MNLIGKYKNAKHFLTSVFQVIKNRYPARKLNVIGVTGTDGKTTTAHLIYEILKTDKKSVALISSVAAYAGSELIDTGLHTTTPDATVLQPLLRKFTSQGIKYVVLEVTSHGLDQHRTLGANFYLGVLTNITHEHLDYHKTFEAYREAKAKLFRGVKIAVLNRDDPSFEFVKERLPGGAKLIAYGGSDKLLAIPTTLPGKFNRYNILAATAATKALGISSTTIKKALQSIEQIPGRLEKIETNRGFDVYVDFAHTPNALENVLKTLKPKNGRLIAVFGCAGERDKGKRPLMGEIAAKLADISIFTAEDPRSEDVNEILGQIVKGAKNAKSKHKYFCVPDRGEAIKQAVEMARKGDIVVICGKGHERSMAYNGVEYPWSDQEAVKKALGGQVLTLRKPNL